MQLEANPNLLSLADGSQLTLLNLVRVIPNRREVYRAHWQGQDVFAKVFMGENATKYAKRDEAGIRVLVEEGIATPALLYAGAASAQDGSQIQVIVLEEIKNAKTADALLPTLGHSARFELAKNLVKIVALHHASEVLHTDIHLKNFLVTQDFIYTLDGDGVRQYADLTYKPAQQNLAMLISKLDALDQDAWLNDLVEAYKQICVWHLPPKPAQIGHWASQYRLKAAHDYADKKVFRTCTDVRVSRPSGNFLAINTVYSPAEMAFSAEALDDLIAQSNSRLKNGYSATVIAMQINEQAFALKRYNIKSVWHGVKRALQPSRAAVSWANAHRLQLLGVATPKPAMMLEVRKMDIRRQAYFMSELMLAPNARESDSAPDAMEYFAQTHDKLKRAEAVRNICTLFYKLFLLQISHGDMKATNIKMHIKTQGTQPVLIDLDAMRQHRSKRSANKAHINDLQRFMQNWIDDIPLYNAFIKTFKVVYPDASILVKAGIGANKELSTG